jgi:mRNA-degrading endonuclease RelE of RelBE toxin-antitoxin system
MTDWSSPEHHRRCRIPSSIRLGEDLEDPYLARRVAPSDDPRRLGAALKGDELGRFRNYRIGDYRVIAEIRDREVRIVAVRPGHRRDVYR